MAGCGSDVLIQDLEDFTPPVRRPEARAMARILFAQWRAAGAIPSARINPLDRGGLEDLAAVLTAGAQIISYPKAESGEQMRALDVQIARFEARAGMSIGTIEILPVCETALGVVNVREIATASARVHCAMLGAEDLAADLGAERGPDAIELDHSRQRFILECRAARIEPVDAPYTFADVDGAAREAQYARRLGYRCKSLVRPEHVHAIRNALTPSTSEIEIASHTVHAFEAARSEGHDRVLVEGRWIEVPTYLNAVRLLERAAQLSLWNG